MTWTPRTSAPSQGTQPYDWNSSYRLYGGDAQCTWYAYYRVQEGFNITDPPCWYSGSGSSGYGAWTTAKYWLDHYRDPWQVKGVSGYTPTPGDIIVFTGASGHVAVVESKNSDGTYVLTDVNLINGDHNWGRKTNYTFPNTIIGPDHPTGSVIGVLHYPNASPDPPTPTDDNIEIILDCYLGKKKKLMKIKIE